jgi:hypothetical protein
VVAGWPQGDSRVAAGWVVGVVGGSKQGGREGGRQAGRQAGGQAKVPPQCMPKIRRGQISTL